MTNIPETQEWWTEFGEPDRLRVARENRRLTKEQLAEAIGTHPQTIAAYEDRSDPRKRKAIVVKQWAVATGTSFAWLRHGTIAAAPPPEGGKLVEFPGGDETGEDEGDLPTCRTADITTLRPLRIAS